MATIGPSITIRGALTGGEDLCLEGRLEGEISVAEHSVTVGSAGRVQADVYGRSVYVEGQVKGNLFGKEQVVIRASGKVVGNVTAPRVTLENGSHFRGSIDMSPTAGAGKGRKEAGGNEAAAGSADSARPDVGGGSGQPTSPAGRRPERERTRSSAKSSKAGSRSAATG